jgi:hypothetical protein
VALASDPTPRAASIELSQSQVKLGEPLTVTIRVDRAFRLPASLDVSPFTELSRTSGEESLDGKSLAVFRVKVACYEKLGPIEFPGLTLEPAGGPNQDPLTLAPVPVNIVSVMEGGEQLIPRAMAPPVAVFVHDYRLLVMMCLMGLWFMMAWLTRKTKEPQKRTTRLEKLPPPLLSHEIALGKLDQIVSERLIKAGHVHQFFIRVSETVREYLGNRYSFFALDQTTNELLKTLRDKVTPHLDLAVLQQQLSEADLVKFARMQATDAMCSNLIDFAYDLLERTQLVDESLEKQR